MILAEKIIQLRKKNGLSQEELAVNLMYQDRLFRSGKVGLRFAI